MTVKMGIHTLPFTPPSINHVYIHLKNGRKVLNKDGKEFIRKVRELLEGAEKINKPTPVMLSVIFQYTDRRRRDIDNCMKVLQDSLEGVLFDDDCQIVMLKAEKLLGCTEAKTTLEVKAVPENDRGKEENENARKDNTPKK